MPIAIRFAMSELPPYEIKGKGTPVVGRIPHATPT